MKNGTGWSTVLVFNGVVLILICVAFILIGVGAFFFIPRLIGACLSCFLSFFHVAAIVITGVYRFSDQGKLASICLAPSKYISVD